MLLGRRRETARNAMGEGRAEETACSYLYRYLAPSRSHTPKQKAAAATAVAAAAGGGDGRPSRCPLFLLLSSKGARERPTASSGGTNQRTYGRTNKRGSQSKRRRTKETNSTRLDDWPLAGAGRRRSLSLPPARTSSHVPSRSSLPPRRLARIYNTAVYLSLSLSLPSFRARESTYTQAHERKRETDRQRLE